LRRRTTGRCGSHNSAKQTHTFLQNRLKTCSKCKASKPLTEFHKSKNRKDGLVGSCKECRNAGYAGYRAENRAVINAKSAEHYAKNRDTINAKNAGHRARNKDSINARARAKYQERSEERAALKLEQRRADFSRWLTENGTELLLCMSRILLLSRTLR
jgi:hypothetical protein